MPITQDRVITLINEALAFRKVHLALREEIMAALQSHRGDPPQAWLSSNLPSYGTSLLTARTSLQRACISTSEEKRTNGTATA